MSKPIIAVDIDDVLSDTAEGFIAFSNDHFGLNLTINDYSEHWAELWKVDIAELDKHAEALDNSGTFESYSHKEHAKQVLLALKSDYELRALTSRRRKLESLTRDWLDEHFTGVFDDVQFAGIFDGPRHTEMLKRTKADLFASNKVAYVIDDQLKHCLAAAALGIETILFGDYPWNQADELPSLITRCHDWLAVAAYFAARGTHV